MEFQSGGPYTKKMHGVHEKGWRINAHLLAWNKQFKVCTHHFCDSFHKVLSISQRTTDSITFTANCGNDGRKSMVYTAKGALVSILTSATLNKTTVVSKFWFPVYKKGGNLSGLLQRFVCFFFFTITRNNKWKYFINLKMLKIRVRQIDLLSFKLLIVEVYVLYNSVFCKSP